MKTSSIKRASLNLFLGMTGILLATGLCRASSTDDNTAGMREFAACATVNTYFSQDTPPSRGVVVQPGTTTGVLLASAGPSSDVHLRIVSGPLRGSIVEGSFSGDKSVFVDINNIRTPYGSDVWMPICKCSDSDGEVDIPRVQVVRDEWQTVRNGGSLGAGTVIHLRILAPVQFDTPSQIPGTMLVARR